MSPENTAEAICSPANVEAAQLFKENVKEYERKVRVSHSTRNRSQASSSAFTERADLCR